MNRPAIAVCCALLLGSVGACGQQRKICSGPQLGTWKLQSYTTEDIATGRKTNLLGRHPSGYLSYGSDCRMYAILVMGWQKGARQFCSNRCGVNRSLQWAYR